MSYNEAFNVVEASKWWASHIFVDFVLIKRHAHWRSVVIWSFFSHGHRELFCSLSFNLRNEIYLNYKLKMDQAFINIRGKWEGLQETTSRVYINRKLGAFPIFYYIWSYHLISGAPAARRAAKRSPIAIGTGSHICMEIETHATLFSW